MRTEAGNFVSDFPQARWNIVLHGQDDIENSYWPSLLHPFITLKVFPGFCAKYRTGPGLVGGATEVFLTMQTPTLPSGPVQEAVG